MSLSEPEIDAIILSLQVAGTALVFALPLAVFAAFALARWRFPGHGLITALIHLPLVLPPVATGYALLLAFGRTGPIGGFLDNFFGVTFAFQWTGAALAAGIMAFPLMFRPIHVAMLAVDPKLEEAGATLGAGAWTRAFTITLPLALPGILAAGVLGFAKALGEFGATITFVSNIPGETRTIALSIYSFTQSPTGDAAALRLILVAVVLSLLAILLSEWLTRRIGGRS